MIENKNTSTFSKSYYNSTYFYSDQKKNLKHRARRTLEHFSEQNLFDFSNLCHGGAVV